ncbi:MAG: TonB-dependent receptor [Deltaproteobacteria bacterium]|nr:TonB-dependent receptor [Deltaproteobacteria bacterium]
MNRRKLLCILVGLLLSQALPTLANDLGNITGIVYGPDQEPWDAIEVVVVRQGTSLPTSTITDQDGWFRFEGLSPGNYLVSISEAGLPTLDNFKVPLMIGATARLRIDLPLSSDIELPARAEIREIDTEQTMLGTSLSGDFMQVLPNFASYQAPFVFAASLDGLALGAEQHVLIDGFFISNPASAQFAGNPNLYAMSEIRLFTAGLDAQYGDTFGPMAMISIPEGSNEFKLQTGLTIRPSQTRWVDLEPDEEADKVFFYQANLNASGPIVKDKLWYFTSVQFDQQLAALAWPFDYNPWNHAPIQPDSRTADSRRFSLLAKLTWRVTDRHDLSLLAHASPAKHDNIFAGHYAYSAETDQQLPQLGSVFGLTWRARWLDNLHQETRVSYGLNHRHRFPQSDCTSMTDESCRAHWDMESGLLSGNSSFDKTDTSHRIAAETSLTWHSVSILGSHTLKVGLQYSLTWRYLSSGIPGGGTYVDRRDRPYTLTLILPNENGEREIATDALGLDTVGIYLQDSWRIGKSLKINLGIRLDLAWLRERSGDQIARSAVLSPRLNIVWDPFQDGKTVMKVGYSRNHANPGMHNLEAWMNTPYRFGKGTWEYNPATGEYDILVSRDSGFFPPSRPDVIELDPVPVDSIHLWIEREILWHISIGIGGQWSRTSYQTTSIPFLTTGCSMSGGTDGTCNKYAVQATIIKRFPKSFQLQASYTFTLASSALEWNDEFPIDWSNELSPEQHTVSLVGIAKLPLGFYLSGALRYSKLDQEFNLDWRDPLDRDVPLSPYQIELDNVRLDFRLAWMHEITPNHRFELSIDFFFSVLEKDDNTRAYPPGSEREYGIYRDPISNMWTSFGMRYWY